VVRWQLSGWRGGAVAVDAGVGLRVRVSCGGAGSNFHCASYVRIQALCCKMQATRARHATMPHTPSADPPAAPTRRRRRGTERRSNCPVAPTLDIVGDRWTLLIVRDLLRGKSRYSDFLASPEHIPTNILAERLKRLEHEGLITGTPYSDHPRRMEYRLTPEGGALGRAVSALARWGLSHFPGTATPASLPSVAESQSS